MKKKIIFAAIFILGIFNIFAYNYSEIEIGTKATEILSELKVYDYEIQNFQDKDMKGYYYRPYGDIGAYDSSIELIQIFVRKNIIVGYSMILDKDNHANMEEAKSVILDYIESEELTLSKYNKNYSDLEGVVKSYYGTNDKMEVTILLCYSENVGYYVSITAMRI